MAGEDLVVTSGLDLAGLQRDFRRGIGLADQFVSDLQRTLSSRELIGDLTPAGRKAGASLARGLAGSLTGVGVGLARSLDLSSAIAAQGAAAGQEFTTALGASIASADDILNRIAASVDLTAGGSRAGEQFTTGIARVIAAEAPALRAAMGQAIVPASIGTDIGRLETVITASLARLPVAFLQSGVASGAALITGIAGELSGARQAIGSFAQETSRALTASLTIGDVSGTGQQTGRLLASAVVSGINAEAPKVREAIGRAFVWTDVNTGATFVMQEIVSEAAGLTPALTREGSNAGRAFIGALTTEVQRGLSGVFRQLTAGAQTGVLVNPEPFRIAAVEQQKLLAGVVETTSALKAEAAAAEQIGARFTVSSSGIVSDLGSLRTAQREWLREAEHGSVAAQALWQRQREAAFQAGQQATKNATQASRDAQAEVAARAQVRAELVGEIQALRTYGRTVDATSSEALTAWRAEAAAIQRQAREVGLARDQMLKLDLAIRDTERAFQRQQAAAQRAASAVRSIAPQQGFGRVATDITRQADTAQSAIGRVAIAGKTMQQITGRLGPALVGVGFGLEALARGGESADAGLRTALRAVASFAAFFGPEGFIVAGAAAATAAIIDLFDRSREEIEATRKKFDEELGRMVDASDFLGLQKQLRDIQIGKPSGGIGLGGTGVFGGSLVDMKARQRIIRDAIVDLDKLNFAQGRFNAKTGEFQGGPLDQLIAENKAALRVLDTQVAEAERQSKAIENVLRNPLTPPREITGLPGVTIASGAKEAEAAFRTLEQEAKTLSIAYQQLNGDAAAQEPIVTRLTNIHDRITAALKTQHGAATETANAYRRMVTELGNIDAVLIETTRRSLPGGVAPTIEPPKITAIIDKVTVPPQSRITIPAEFDPKSLSDSLRGAIDQFKGVQQAEVFAKIFGSQQQQAAATKTVNTETANLTRTFRAAIDAELALAASGKLNVTRINDIIAAAKALGIELEGTAKSSRSLSTTLSDIGAAAFAIADVADAVGGMDREIGDAIANVGRLSESLSDLSKLKLTGEGGVFSSFDDFLKGLPVVGNAISSAINAYRSVFGIITGKSTADENARILKSNTEAIVRLGQNLVGFNESITLFREGRAISTSSILNARAGTSGFQRGFRNVEDLDKELRNSGVSLSELKRRAEEFGITITDAKGRITALGLKDLNAAIEITIRELTTFKDTLADQSFLSSARRDIFDNDSASAIAQDWLTQFKRFAPDLFQKFFAGADVTTKEGRERFEAGIRAVFDLVSKNLIPPEILLQFGGAKGFVEALLDGDHALDDFTDSVREAAGEATNLVKGFRDFNLDRAVFRAQGQNAFALPPTLPPRPSPPQIPVTAPTVGSFTFSPTVVLHDVGDKDITVLSSELVAELKRKATAIANPLVKQTVNNLPA